MNPVQSDSEQRLQIARTELQRTSCQNTTIVGRNTRRSVTIFCKHLPYRRLSTSDQIFPKYWQLFFFVPSTNLPSVRQMSLNETAPGWTCCCAVLRHNNWRNVIHMCRKSCKVLCKSWQTVCWLSWELTLAGQLDKHPVIRGEWQTNWRTQLWPLETHSYLVKLD